MIGLGRNKTTKKSHKSKSKKHGYNVRLNESLGMRRGAKTTKKQSYKSRREESKGMEKDLSRRAYSSVKTMDKNNRKMKKSVISLKNLENIVNKQQELNLDQIKTLRITIQDIIKMAPEMLNNACSMLNGKLYKKECLIDIQKVVKNIMKSLKNAKIRNSETTEIQNELINMYGKNGILQPVMIGGSNSPPKGVVGCQNTQCPNNVRLAYDAEGTIHCDAPKWRGGQEMHYLLGAQY